jgi:hypothetical protein
MSHNIKYTPERIKEISKCMDDPIYFINTYVYIPHPKHGKIKFKLYDFQYEYIKHIENHKFTIGWWSRQTGKTLTTLPYILWNVIFNSNKNAFIMAASLPQSKEMIFILQFMLNNLPDWLKPNIDKSNWNKTSLAFENGSFIHALTNFIQIRGRTVDLIYFDEFAYYVNKGNFEDVFPALAINSKVIIASTGKKDSQFNKLYFYVLDNRSSPFSLFSVSWNQVPGRDSTFKTSMINLIGEHQWNDEYEVGIR